jgi:hypothetical protein
MPARFWALGGGGRVVVAVAFGELKPEELPKRREPT